MSMPLSPEAALGADPARARLLLVTKRRATGLLGLMVVVFLAAVLAVVIGDRRGHWCSGGRRCSGRNSGRARRRSGRSATR